MLVKTGLGLYLKNIPAPSLLSQFPQFLVPGSNDPSVILHDAPRGAYYKWEKISNQFPRSNIYQREKINTATSGRTPSCLLIRGVEPPDLSMSKRNNIGSVVTVYSWMTVKSKTITSVVQCLVYNRLHERYGDNARIVREQNCDAINYWLTWSCWDVGETGFRRLTGPPGLSNIWNQTVSKRTKPQGESKEIGNVHLSTRINSIWSKFARNWWRSQQCVPIGEW
jgi:hypothetical protein